LDIQFRKDEIQSLAVKSDQHIRIRSEKFSSPGDAGQILTLDVPANETKVWRRAEASSNPFRQAVVTELYAKNLGNGPANVTLAVARRVATPEMLLVPIIAVGMAAIFFAYLLQRAAMPKLAAVALSTTKSDIAQPLYAIVMAIGICALIIFVFIPGNTFGDDIKQLKDSGLSTILVLCIF